MTFSLRYLAKVLPALWLLQCGNIAFAEVVLPELPPDLVPELPADPTDPLFPGDGVIDVGDFVSGNVITDVQTLETQVQPLASAMSGQLRNIFQNFVIPRARGGGAAADSGSFQSVWTNYGSTNFENTFSRTLFDGSTDLLLVGYDLAVAENHLLGLMLGSETTEIDTLFNSGRMETDGTTFAPYYGWLISDTWSLDLGFGSSELDTDQIRLTPQSADPAAPLVQVSSSTAAERSFTTANLNGFWTAGDWNLGARLGYLSVESEQDAYIESDGNAVAGGTLNFRQSYIGADMSYGERSQPFIGVTLMQDSSSEKIVFPSGEQPSDDDQSLQLVAGWRYYGEKVNAILEWNKRTGKDQYSEDTLSFTLRFNDD